MMAPYRVGVIGTGKRPEKPGPRGYGMAHKHGAAYQALGQDRCQIVACADIVAEHAAAFAELFDVPRVYLDYHEMLVEEDLDLVSICTWPHLHAQLAIDCAVAGVGAVHCEKPMASTWGEARLMAQEAERRGTRLTFNHQRRFSRAFRRAKELLDDGVIGALQRLETSPPNLYDFGSHAFDLCGYFVDERPASWVLAQIDYRQENLVFGAHNENQSLVQWQYDHGVFGLAVSGKGGRMANTCLRLVGSEGVMELRWERDNALYLQRHDGKGWENVPTDGEGVSGNDFLKRAIADVVQALEQGSSSELNARNALNATEIIFAAWESVRRRGRVELPLTITDNPLAAMVAAGELQPREASQAT